MGLYSCQSPRPENHFSHGFFGVFFVMFGVGDWFSSWLRTLEYLGLKDLVYPIRDLGEEEEMART